MHLSVCVKYRRFVWLDELGLNLKKKKLNHTQLSKRPTLDLPRTLWKCTIRGRSLPWLSLAKAASPWGLAHGVVVGSLQVDSMWSKVLDRGGGMEQSRVLPRWASSWVEETAWIRVVQTLICGRTGSSGLSTRKGTLPWDPAHKACLVPAQCVFGVNMLWHNHLDMTLRPWEAQAAKLEKGTAVPGA